MSRKDPAPTIRSSTLSGFAAYVGQLAITCVKARLPDTSFAGEYRHLAMLLEKLRIETGFAVDIAAADGVEKSSTLPLFRDHGWSGLAVEMSPRRFARLAMLYAAFPGARLVRGRVTPSTIVPLLRGLEVPEEFEMLNLDIDSYDLGVMREMLAGGFRPKVISMEINESIPPPIYFTVEYDEHHFWQGDRFFGCSLSAATSVVRPMGYLLESVEYNNAMFVRADMAAGRLTDCDDAQAYDEGYRNKPDRLELFRKNGIMEPALNRSTPEAIAFLREQFKAYDGMYTLR